MDKLRLVFEQTGRAIWISHLDMMRTMQRAMNRAGVPIKYSEGFNPHAYISIVMPLSVGTGSLCQLADIRVREDIDIAALPAKLTAAMPEGIRVTDCYEEGMKPALLKWLRVSGVWTYDDRETDIVAKRVSEFFKQDEVIVTRRTKRGEGPFNLSEHVKDLSFRAEGNKVIVEGIVSAAEPVVNPELLTNALRQNVPELAPDASVFTRCSLYTAEGKNYR